MKVEKISVEAFCFGQVEEANCCFSVNKTMKKKVVAGEDDDTQELIASHSMVRMLLRRRPHFVVDTVSSSKMKPPTRASVDASVDFLALCSTIARPHQFFEPRRVFAKRGFPQHSSNSR